MRNKVPQMTHLCLTDAMDATKALLNAVRVPWQVVVHHQVGALQVDALTSRISSDKHFHFRVVAEQILDAAPFVTTHTTMDRHHCFSVTKQRADLALEIIQCVSVLGEHNDLAGLTWRVELIALQNVA